MGKQTGISMIKPASVVSVRGRKPDVLRADSDFVYVGPAHGGWRVRRPNGRHVLLADSDFKGDDAL